MPSFSTTTLRRITPKVALETPCVAACRWKLWTATAKNCAPLEAKYQSITPDSIRFGETGPWSGPSDSTHDAQTRLTRALIERLSDEQVDVVGHLAAPPRCSWRWPRRSCCAGWYWSSPSLPCCCHKRQRRRGGYSSTCATVPAPGLECPNRRVRASSQRPNRPWVTGGLTSTIRRPRPRCAVRAARSHASDDGDPRRGDYRTRGTHLRNPTR
jgi:hypothetical protein